VTIDNSEWLLGAIYDRALRDGDSTLALQVSKEYVPHFETLLNHYERLSKEFLGYELPQILLLHANRLTAHCLGELTEMLTQRGYAFISLAEALQDSAYSLPELPNKRGVSWLHRWRDAAGLAYDPEPDLPDWVMQLWSEGYR
jgi:hypothetical protein